MTMSTVGAASRSERTNRYALSNLMSFAIPSTALRRTGTDEEADANPRGGDEDGGEEEGGDEEGRDDEADAALDAAIEAASCFDDSAHDERSESNSPRNAWMSDERSAISAGSTEGAPGATVGGRNAGPFADVAAVEDGWCTDDARSTSDIKITLLAMITTVLHDTSDIRPSGNSEKNAR